MKKVVVNKTPKVVIKPKNKEEKKKALELAVAQIEKNFGEGSIMTLGKNAKRTQFGSFCNPLTCVLTRTDKK